MNFARNDLAPTEDALSEPRRASRPASPRFRLYRVSGCDATTESSNLHIMDDFVQRPGAVDPEVRAYVYSLVSAVMYPQLTSFNID